jgi:protein TonB
MYKRNLIIAGFIALALHAAVVIAPSATSEPEVIFKKGESSLKMHLVPSAASTASTKSINDLQENHKVEKKTVEKPKPLQKTEPVAVTKPVNKIQKQVLKVEEKMIDSPKPVENSKKTIEKQVKVEDVVVQKVKEINYSTEYFKPDSEIKDKQIQKQNVNTNNSKEIIADVKTKGVSTGATVKNVFKPSYPSSCKRQGHEGTTVLEVTVLSNGKRGNIDIIKSAGCESLDKAAIKALKKAKYIPAKRLGVSFTATKKIAFNFKLEDYQ